MLPTNISEKKGEKQEMRYIRTNKGRIIDTNNVCIGNKETDFKSLEHYFEVLKDGGEEIINQADTIEELCDEFVMVDIGPESKEVTRYVRSIDLLNDMKSLSINYPHRCTTYGAIWTDKGLIYVAKMNDKGELELL